MNKNNIAIFDWDETLCSSLYANNEAQADEFLERYGQYNHGVKFQLPNDGWYVSFIRSWSKDLVQYFQTTLGLDNVCILSWGSCDYVLRSANLLDIGIPPTNIFTREDMGYTVPRFKDKNCVLVDNEYYSFHIGMGATKVTFLYGLEPEKFVNVPNFDVRYFQEQLDLTLDEVIQQIEKAFEYESTEI